MAKPFLFAAGVAVTMAASTQAAVADTIEAGVKPYFVGGGLAAALALAVFAFLMIRRGLGTRRIARESAHWPVAEGEILAASVGREWRSLGPTNRYEVYVPKVRYSYAVDGRRHEGGVLRAGLDQFGYASEAAAQMQLEPYRIGETVPVRYDPRDPAIAMLEAAEYGGARNIFAGVLFALVGAGALVFALWAATLPTR